MKIKSLMNEFNKFYTKLNFEYISSKFELQLEKKKDIIHLSINP